MSDKTYNKPPWIKTGRRTRAMRSAKKQKNMELRDKRRAEGRYNWTHGFWDDLSKERQIEVLEEIIEHDSKNPRYSWNSGEIYDPSSQYDDKTVPSVAFLLDGKNVNPKVMLEHLKKSAEEGNTPVQEPMEFGEMANWRPMDGTPGLKRQRAEGLEEYGRFVDANGKTIMIVSTETVNEDNEEAAIEEFRRLSKGRYPGMSFVRKSAEYISDLSNGIVQFEDGSGFSSASAPPNDIHFGAENQVFALTYWIEEGVNIDDISDVSEALELYLSLSDDIAEMEDLELQKHPRYELAKKLQSDLSYRMDELQTAVPDITTDIEMDAEYDAWRSAFADGASATMLHKYDRNWMSKVNNPRSTYIKSYWNDSEPEFMEELRSAEGLTPNQERLANTFQWLEDNALALGAAILTSLYAYRKL